MKIFIAVFENKAITEKKPLEFLQFKAQKEKQISEKFLDKVLERNINLKKSKSYIIIGNTTNSTKYVVNTDDFVKVMNHIQNDPVGVEPENLDPTN